MLTLSLGIFTNFQCFLHILSTPPSEPWEKRWKKRSRFVSPVEPSSQGDPILTQDAEVFKGQLLGVSPKANGFGGHRDGEITSK